MQDIIRSDAPRPLAKIFLVLIMLASPYSGYCSFSIQAVVNHSIFFLPPSAAGGTARPFMELYWQIDPSSLPFTKKQNFLSSKIKTDIVVQNDTGIIFEDHYILETAPAASLEEALAARIIDLRRFGITTGKISISFQLSDLVAKNNSFVYRDSIQIDNPPAKPFYSSVQMLDTITGNATGHENSPFLRNGRLQIPLCANFLGENRKRLTYYAELYNTRTVPAEELPLIQKIYISKKGQDAPFYGLTSTDTVQEQEVTAVNGYFSIATLPSGNYNLNVGLFNRLQQPLASQRLFFQVMNPSPEVPATAASSQADTTGTGAKTGFLNLNKTFAGKYTSAQIRAILKMLIPISDPTEQVAINSFLNKPDEMYMRFFIYNFWQRRDNKNPEGAWKAYTEKIKLVNKQFGSSLTAGYESDRGIIYLKYGKPAEIVPVPNEEGSLPYEIWQYNATARQGSPAIFLFYRPGFMINGYKLLHSTAIGEVRNTAWRDVLYPDGHSSDRPDSRAEQYLGNK